jgi:hypothetical protein
MESKKVQKRDSGEEINAAIIRKKRHKKWNINVRYFSQNLLIHYCKIYYCFLR